MTASAKNLLQEYYQSIGKPNPTYCTINDSDKPHKPQWVSTVTLENGDTFSSLPKQIKKEAEKEAAELALASIPKMDSSIQWKNTTQEIPTVIYIDVENQSRSAIDLLKILKRNAEKLPNYVQIMFVISNECSLVDRIKLDITSLNHKNLGFIITQSAAKTRITIEVSRVILLADVIILSNDKFAQILKKELDNMSRPPFVIKTPTTFDEFCLLVFS